MFEFIRDLSSPLLAFDRESKAQIKAYKSVGNKIPPLIREIGPYRYHLGVAITTARNTYRANLLVLYRTRFKKNTNSIADPTTNVQEPQK
jgi:hypothetical protein